MGFEGEDVEGVCNVWLVWMQCVWCRGDAMLDGEGGCNVWL
jgi:hypothetical protein